MRDLRIRSGSALRRWCRHWCCLLLEHVGVAFAVVLVDNIPQGRRPVRLWHATVGSIVLGLVVILCFPDHAGNRIESRLDGRTFGRRHRLSGSKEQGRTRGA